jgi:hypothetical protein
VYLHMARSAKPPVFGMGTGLAGHHGTAVLPAHVPAYVRGVTPERLRAGTGRQ